MMHLKSELIWRYMSKIVTLFLLVGILFFTGCSTRGVGVYSGGASKTISTPKTYSDNKSVYSTTINQKDLKHPTMRSYFIYGIEYFPALVSVGEEFTGNASWYGPDFHGKLTSNGERYNMYDMTAAHKTFPMNTIVKVTNLKNGLHTIVRINDRGPFVATRIIDLSNTAAKEIDMLKNGTAPVRVEVLGYYKQNLIDTNTIGSPVNKNQRVEVATTPTMDPRPKAPPVTSTSSISYALQIASFSKIESAIKIQETFTNANGYRAEIKDIENENGRIFKVWIKGFKNEQEVRDYKALGYYENAFIVREDR